jgi:riboflavin kinase/FMN adenylyltransferase
MQHVTSLEALRLAQPACVTLGSFDGVHLGHQAIIRGMVEHAHPAGRAAVVITFYPHPSVVLRGRRPSFYLSTPEAQAELLLALGVDAVVTHPFNHEVANIRAADFVTALMEHAQMRELWCGEDFTLGHNREGTVPFLQAEGARCGFTVRVTPPVLIDGELVSSTRIRQTLRDGAVEQAARYLGRPYRLPGIVTAGDRRGHQLGFPTANLSVGEELAVPANGIYACWAYPAAGRYAAAASIGLRPTFETSDPKVSLEAYLLNFSGDLYHSALALDFVARLRPELKFSSVEALRKQIKRDVEETRHILKVKREP